MQSSNVFIRLVVNISAVHPVRVDICVSHRSNEAEQTGESETIKALFGKRQRDFKKSNKQIANLSFSNEKYDTDQMRYHSNPILKWSNLQQTILK